jgi:hypothetical protein
MISLLSLPLFINQDRNVTGEKNLKKEIIRFPYERPTVGASTPLVPEYEY